MSALRSKGKPVSPKLGKRKGRWNFETCPKYSVPNKAYTDKKVYLFIRPESNTKTKKNKKYRIQHP